MPTPELDLDGVPVFDREKALRMAGGEVDLLQELAETILEDVPDKLQRIREALAAEAWDTLRGLAHYVKGGAANVGAERLRRAAECVETAVRDGDTTTAAAVAPTIEEEVQQLSATFAEVDWEAWIAANGG